MGRLKRLFSVTLSVILVISSAAVGANAALSIKQSQARPVQIEIFHTNDVHGAAEQVITGGQLTTIGYARAKTYIDAQQADMKLLLDAGDVLQGYPFVTVQKGDSAARLIKAMGYDAIAPGNHDFDYGIARLEELTSQYSLPFIAANVYRGTSRVFKPYVVKESNGVRVGVFGLSTPETAYKTTPSNVAGITFGSSAKVFQDAQSIVRQLRTIEQADVVIALTHLGSEDWAQPSSVQLANNVQGIDVIIDGHSHSQIDTLVNGTYIASTGAYFATLGHMSITVGTDKKLTVTDELIRPESFENIVPDKQILDICASVRASMAAEMEKIVGYTPVLLDGGRVNVRGKSTNLGRLVTGAMLDESGAEIAIANGGSIRDSIQAGSITKEDLVRVLPYANVTMKVGMTGAQIRSTLNAAMIDQTGGFPQFYGMTVRAYPVTRINASGSEYKAYEVDSITVGGVPLDDNKLYEVAINDYMYSGGDAYTECGKAAVLGEYRTLSDTFIDYISRVDVAQAAGDDTLIFVDGPSAQAATATAAPAVTTSQTAPVRLALASAA